MRYKPAFQRSLKCSATCTAPSSERLKGLASYARPSSWKRYTVSASTSTKTGSPGQSQLRSSRVSNASVSPSSSSAGVACRLLSSKASSVQGGTSTGSPSKVAGVARRTIWLSVLPEQRSARSTRCAQGEDSPGEDSPETHPRPKTHTIPKSNTHLQNCE